MILRVQGSTIKAFLMNFCKENRLPVIGRLKIIIPIQVRAVTELLRIWTSRIIFFKENPNVKLTRRIVALKYLSGVNMC